MSLKRRDEMYVTAWEVVAIIVGYDMGTAALEWIVRALWP